MGSSEELRETLLDLEDARKREAHHRHMAEALLEGLRVLVASTDPHELFTKLFEAMKKPLEFEAAFVLIENHGGALTPLTSSDDIFMQTVWQPGTMLKRVIKGQPVAVFDTELVEEWRTQPQKLKLAARSALHFSIHTPRQRAIMVCTHSNRAHFSKDHVTLARRFSVLATQALQKLESEEKLADLEKKLESEVKVAELHRRLAESEQKLARARRMEAVGLLAGGVAHDLNNILTGIASYPELLLMDDTLPPEYRGALETIRDAGFRAAAVVEDLLTVAKGIASQRETVNLNPIIGRYLLSHEHQRLLQLHERVEIKEYLEKNLFNISGSSVHVTKAIMNLVYNAVEAVQHKTDGQVRISTENRYIDGTLKGYNDIKTGEYAVLSVWDNGPGILPDDLEHIFEPFYTKKRLGMSGTGLGLTVVWNVMEDHGGYVDIATGRNGTEFCLYFPATRDALSEADVMTVPDDFRGNGETVLVIDDLEDQRKIACAILTKLGYKACSAESGETALEYLKDNPVDFIVLDMIMDPGMNGLETYSRIIEMHPGQKAVIASGYSNNEDVVEAQSLGAGSFVKKPYTLAKLGYALRKELEKDRN